MIDPHVHFRKDFTKDGESVEHGLKVAESVGVGAVFDMPNTNPPIISKDLVEKRLELADKANSPVFYGLYMGLTANPFQIEEAVRVYHKFFPRVVGLKLYAGRSVGNLAVIEEQEQDLVYETLAKLDYRGMLIVHCEKESLIKKKPDGTQDWDPKKPITHYYARPPEAEVKSVRDQIKYATFHEFKGNLHITHISVPEAVELVENARDRGKIRISCGTTPHHCLLNNSIMESLPPKKAVFYKMNPPLRDAEPASKILEYLKDGTIDYLETDHAPHTLEEKTSGKYLSGIPNLPFYPIIIKELKNKRFSQQRIEEITNTAIKELFEIDLPEKELKIGGDFSKDYCFNPYEHLKNQKL